MTELQFAELLRRQPEGAILLALEQVKTADGALLILRAEQGGLRRRQVLATAHRRLSQLDGSERPGQRVAIVAEGVAMETARLAFEKRK